MSEKTPFRFGSTFAERKAAREGKAIEQPEDEAKQIDADESEVEDKAITAKRPSRKKS